VREKKLLQCQGTNALTTRDKSYTTRNEFVWSVTVARRAKYCNVMPNFTLQYSVFHCFYAWSHPYYMSVCLTDLYKYSLDAVPPTSSGLFLATIYNQSQLAERKHVTRYWLINIAAMVVPLSAHPSPLVITTKLAAAILGGRLFGGGVLPAQYCPCGLPAQIWCGTRVK